MAGEGVGAALAGLNAVGTAGLAAGGAIGALALGTAAAVEATKTLSRTMTGAARDVAQVSGQVSAAMAGNEVKRINAMIRRDQAVGPQLARFTSSQGNLEAAIEDLKTTIVRMFGGPMTELTQYGADITKGLDELGKMLGPLPGNLAGWAARLAKFGNPLLGGLDALAAMGRQAREREFQNIQQELLDFLSPAHNLVPQQQKSNRKFPRGVR